MLAKFAVSTICLVAWDNMIPWLDRGDALTHTLNNACSLMPQNAGEKPLEKKSSLK
jgi:hypothetical protein